MKLSTSKEFFKKSFSAIAENLAVMIICLVLISYMCLLKTELNNKPEPHSAVMRHLVKFLVLNSIH